MIWSPVPLVRVIVPVLVVQPGAGTLAGSIVNVADSLIFPSRLADPVPVTETQTKLGSHGTTVPTSEVLAENGSRLVAPANCGIATITAITATRARVSRRVEIITLLL